MRRQEPRASFCGISNELKHCIHFYFSFHAQVGKALTLPLTLCRHMGQCFSAGEHSAQHTRWPHGRNTIHTSLSRQILHMRCCRISLFSVASLSISPAHSKKDFCVCVLGLLFFTVNHNHVCWLLQALNISCNNNVEMVLIHWPTGWTCLSVKFWRTLNKLKPPIPCIWLGVTWSCGNFQRQGKISET